MLAIAGAVLAVLAAGGGTGDGTIMMAQQLADAGNPGTVTYVDLSDASRAIAEARAGAPSHATADLTGAVALTDAEIRERMSGNICRCAAYPNIVAAIRDAAAGGGAA